MRRCSVNIDIYNLIINRLKDKGFEMLENKDVKEIGAVIFKSSAYHVVIKKLHYIDQLELISSFAFEIKNILMENKVNINNSYLLLCFATKVNYETFFLIERNTKAMRKYAIINENDLNRIPFLDKLNADEVGLDFEYNKEENIYLSELSSFMNEKKGLQNKLKTNEIDEAVERVMHIMEGNHEN